MISKLICTSILLSCLAACGSPDTRSPENMVNELMAIWESGEADRLPELMSIDVVYDDIPNGSSLQGIDASIGYVTHVHKWASNIEITVHRSFGNETDVGFTLSHFSQGSTYGRSAGNLAKFGQIEMSHALIH